MRPVDKIKRTIENAKIKINQDVKKTALKQLINELEQTKNNNSVKHKPNTGRIIMNSKLFKLAAAAIIIIAILIGINHFSDSNAAFADVIGYFQKHSYTFDLEGLTEKPIHAMVWELGRIRIDYPPAVEVGDMSSITDFNTEQTLLLYHQDKTAVMKKETAYQSLGTEEIISLCTRPIAELWNVLNGEEEYLGEKEINGKCVSGFRITKENQNFEFDITVWADFKSGLPIMVETITKPLGESYPSIKTTMGNFNLDVELDENLFSLDLPPEYTLAYQEDLENLEVETELSKEAEKIVYILTLASENRIEDAIEALLEIDWTKPIEFGKELYIFLVSEKEYKALKAEDQKRVDEQTSADMKAIQDISKEVLALGQKAVADQQYEKAEIYFNAGLQLGRLLEQNPNTMVIPRLVGISIERNASKEMIELYTITNDNEKLREAQNQLSKAEAEVDRIKEEAKQMNQ